MALDLFSLPTMLAYSSKVHTALSSSSCHDCAARVRAVQGRFVQKQDCALTVVLLTLVGLDHGLLIKHVSG